MTISVALKAEIREKAGKGPCRRLRDKGSIPAIVYGDGKEVIQVTLERKEVTRCYKKGLFFSTVINIEVGDNTIKVLPRALQLDPVSDDIIHVDFLRMEDNKNNEES